MFINVITLIKLVTVWICISTSSNYFSVNCHTTVNKRQLLTTIIVETKLPNKVYGTVPWYDGDDTIYLFGGWNGKLLNQILTYSVSNQTIQNVGVLPFPSCCGTVQVDSFGDVFYFGGNSDFKHVFKFYPSVNRTVVMSILPTNILRSRSFKGHNGSDVVYIFGGKGQGKELLSFDMHLLTYRKVRNLEFTTYPATSIEIGNKLFVYGCDQRKMMELNLDSFVLSLVSSADVPTRTQYPSSVSDGNFAYIIGGYKSNSIFPTGGLIQFDPKPGKNAFIPVRNFPVEGLSYYERSGECIFVSKMDRIYCFGGRSYDYVNGKMVGAYRDDIFYIDLSPINVSKPTEAEITYANFTCANRTNDNYPNPLNCFSHLRCRAGVLTTINCTETDIFDSTTKKCEEPTESLQCDTSCEKVKDGKYPSAHDCSFFILCRAEQSSVFKCPNKLIFDSKSSSCLGADKVTCAGNAKHPLLIT